MIPFQGRVHYIVYARTLMYSSYLYMQQLTENKLYNFLHNLSYVKIVPVVVQSKFRY